MQAANTSEASGRAGPVLPSGPALLLASLAFSARFALLAETHSGACSQAKVAVS